MSTKRVIMTAIALAVLALVFATLAVAQNNRQGNRNQRQQGPRPAFGEIIAMDASSITIAPEIPQEMIERMAENGIEPPELPEEMTFAIDDNTKYITIDGQTESSAFSVGDMVVIRPAPGEGDAPLAGAIATAEAARQYIGNRMGQGQRGQDGQRGQGGQGQRGEQGQRGPGGQQGQHRPAFGSILSIDATSITIKPEIPEMMRERMPENAELPELPDELVITLDENTKFVRVDGEVDSAEFAVGEQVVIRLMKGEGEQPVAVVIADLEAAKQFLKKQGEGGQQRGEGQRRGEGQGRGKRGEGGQGRGGGGEGRQRDR